MRDDDPYPFDNLYHWQQILKERGAGRRFRLLLVAIFVAGCSVAIILNWRR
jgi:hypothetical protein